MPVTITERNEGRTLVVHVRDKLTREDYAMFVPRIEALIERHGKVNFVARLDDLEGVSAGALWEDVKFDAKHFNDLARVAIVGDRRWTEWMTTFCKPFTTAQVEFFRPDRFQDALDWATGRSVSA